MAVRHVMGRLSRTLAPQMALATVSAALMAGAHGQGMATAVAASSPMAEASQASPLVFEGYDAFYSSLGATVFKASDERTYARQGAGEPYGDFWRWKSGGGVARVIELRGADILVNGRRLSASKATVFDGEGRAPALGKDATIYANDQHVCVQGVPSSASGTAVRHVRVSLVLNAFTPQARRIELPSLFASCLGVYASPDGGVRFFRNRYRWEGTGNPQGVEFEEMELRGARFTSTGRKLLGSFVEDANVYRFTSP